RHGFHAPTQNRLVCPSTVCGAGSLSSTNAALISSSIGTSRNPRPSIFRLSHVMKYSGVPGHPHVRHSARNWRRCSAGRENSSRRASRHALAYPSRIRCQCATHAASWRAMRSSGVSRGPSSSTNMPARSRSRCNARLAAASLCGVTRTSSGPTFGNGVKRISPSTSRLAQHPPHHQTGLIIGVGRAIVIRVARLPPVPRGGARSLVQVLYHPLHTRPQLLVLLLPPLGLGAGGGELVFQAPLFGVGRCALLDGHPRALEDHATIWAPLLSVPRHVRHGLHLLCHRHSAPPASASSCRKIISVSSSPSARDA